jgi:hypothetical protein
MTAMSATWSEALIRKEKLHAPARRDFTNFGEVVGRGIEVCDRIAPLESQPTLGLDRYPGLVQIRMAPLAGMSAVPVMAAALDPHGAVWQILTREGDAICRPACLIAEMCCAVAQVFGGFYGNNRNHGVSLCALVLRVGSLSSSRFYRAAVSRAIRSALSPVLVE